MRLHSKNSICSRAKTGPEHSRLTLRRGHNNAAWRAVGIILPVLAAMLLISAAPKTGRAQAVNSVVYDGNAPYCSDGCCQEFTITIDTSTDTVDIVLGAWAGPAPDCFDETCWSGQGTATETFDKGWGAGNGNFRIVASHTDRMWLGNSGTPKWPVTLTVYICGTYDCLQHYDRWNWLTAQGSSWESGNLLPLYEGTCQATPACGTGCSYITVAPWGTDPDCTGCTCGTKVCFYNAAGTQSQFILKCDPPLDPYNTCGVGGSSLACSTAPFNPNPNYWVVTSSPSGAAFVSNYDATTGEVTIYGGPINNDIPNCGEICLYIPRCDNDPGTYEHISLVSPTNPGTCSSDNTSIIVDLKKSVQVAAMPSDSGGQNYPNPVGASSGFKTTIPFTTSADGVASIQVVDATGKEVLRDNEEVTYAGTHFFYFTANKLPAGTYYYTIEFPQGVVIASKTMLVVK
ncbi:MAG TPA: T9SS type A sorting domain-containing protein [Candidatus Kapabacteria bacterium]|nr:T9SS type A sorting domain-containing protein [Candidatus Kapabacteria bacterium]